MAEPLVKFIGARFVMKCFFFLKDVLGLGGTKHKEEVPPETVEKLFKLFNDLSEVIRSRGTDRYHGNLSSIPAKYHHKINYLLQYTAQV